MTLDKFFNKQPLGKENIYQILVVPNITKQRELSKDSYVLVMSNVIKELNKKRKDLAGSEMRKREMEKVRKPEKESQTVMSKSPILRTKKTSKIH